jgi:CDP-glucose 4,6-dehydratase
MTVLVTGAGGFVGHELLLRLCNLGWPAIGMWYDRAPRPYGMDAEWVRGDVINYGRMLEILVDWEIEYVFHLAAKSVVRNCRSDPLGCFRTNIIGTANILEAARQSDRIKGVLCMESDKTYGPGPVPYREDQAIIPSGVYEVSKACVTHLASAYWNNYSLPVFTVRSCNIYGPQDHQTSRLIPNTIRRLSLGKDAQITEGAEHFVREFIYVEDWCDCVIRLMKAKPWGEVFNVGSGETHTVGQVVSLICNIFGVEYHTQPWARPKTLLEIPQQQLCLDKLHECLGEKLTMRSLEAGIREIVRLEKTPFPNKGKT